MKTHRERTKFDKDKRRKHRHWLATIFYRDGELMKYVTVSPGIEGVLAEGLHARNIIVHRVLIDYVKMFPTPHTRAKLIKEIRVLCRKVRAADKVLSPFINAFSAALDGIENEQIEK